MKIKAITSVGKRKVYDISVEGEEHYLLDNGVASHNTGLYYSADNIWIIGRQQEKEDKDIVGYHFIINVDKSRFVKEKSKIPISVTYESGINKWSGLLDLALEGGYVTKPKIGWYATVDKETGELGPNKRAADIIDNNDFWKTILDNTDFAAWIEKKYKSPHSNIMRENNDQN